MDAKELRNKSREELVRMVAELEATIRDLRFKTATRQLTKVRDVRKAKRDLARIKSVLTVTKAA